MGNENEKKLLHVGSTYKLVIFSCGQTLTYTAQVLSVDANFVKFKDRFGKIFNYNLNSVVSFCGVENENQN